MFHSQHKIHGKCNYLMKSVSNIFITYGQLREKDNEKRKEMREKEIESQNARPKMIHGEREPHKGIKEYAQPRARILGSKPFTTATNSRHCVKTGVCSLGASLSDDNQSTSGDPRLALKLVPIQIQTPWAEVTLYDHISENRFCRENKGER